MTIFKPTLIIVFAALALLPGGCAPQPTTPMQVSMNSMEMPELMAHCEQMKKQIQPGVTINPDMYRCINMYMDSFGGGNGSVRGGR